MLNNSVPCSTNSASSEITKLQEEAISLLATLESLLATVLREPSPKETEGPCNRSRVVNKQLAINSYIRDIMERVDI